MKNFLILNLLTLLFSLPVIAKAENFTIAFGSCNKHDLPQPLWNKMLLKKPNLFIWGGDTVYTDILPLAEGYVLQKKNPIYQAFLKEVPVIGIWDDHDFGLNNGGKENLKKDENKKLFLDFMDEPITSQRRSQKGLYTSYTYFNDRIKVILLDARYFRDSPKEGGTMLGDEQWVWLKNELANSKSKLHIIVSGIQVISDKQPYETWGQFPKERERLFSLIKDSKVQGAIIISGDRHIGEISKIEIPGMSYPLIDITSSGLTHAFKEFKGEENPYRIGKTWADLHYGLFTIDMIGKKIHLRAELIDQENVVRNSIEVTY